MSINTDITRHLEENRLAGVVTHNGLAYLAGQVADDATLDTEGQTADILRQIDALLADVGTDKTRILFGWIRAISPPVPRLRPSWPIRTGG